MLTEKLSQDLVQAMKAKDDARTGALRLLLSAAKNKQIEIGHSLSDDEFLAVVTKEVKQRKDSIAQYTQANRQDLVDQEQVELDILSEYLPEQLSDSEIIKHIDTAVSETQATAVSDIGKVMAALSHLKGQADMGQVSQLVKQRLASS